MAPEFARRLAFPGVADPYATVTSIVQARRAVDLMIDSLPGIQYEDLTPLLGGLPTDCVDRRFDKRTVDSLVTGLKPLQAEHEGRTAALQKLREALDSLIGHVKQTEPKLLLKVVEDRREELKKKSQQDNVEVRWLEQKKSELEQMLAGPSYASSSQSSSAAAGATAGTPAAGRRRAT